MKVKHSSTSTDLKNFDVEIDGQDISEFVTQASIFQDVFFPVWTCEMLIHDLNNLIMNIPIIPGKKIKIKIETEVESELDAEKEFEFIVSNIKDRKFHNWMNQSYLLVCVNEKIFENQGERVSKAFIEKKPDEIVKKILKDNLKIDEVESDSCDNKISTIIPNVSPLHAVNMLSKFATKDKVSDFLFFQTDNKKYKFKSFEKLYNEDCGYKFKMKAKHIRGEAGSEEEDYTLDFFEYQFIEHVDGLFAMSTGLGANKLVEFDYVKKKWSEVEYKYSDELSSDREKAPWDGRLEKPNSNIVFMPKHPGMHETKTVLDYTSEWETSRKNNLLKMELNKLIIQMPGGVKIWETLGKSCEIEMPSQQDHDEGEKYDKYFKGKYFIAAIGHMITKTAYLVNLELIKKRTEKQMQ